MKLIQKLHKLSSSFSSSSSSSSSSFRPAYFCFSSWSSSSSSSDNDTTKTQPTNTTSISSSSSSSLSQEELTQINLLIPRLCSSNHLKEATNLIITALLTNPPLKSLSLSIFIHTLSIQPDLTLPMYFLNRLKHSSPNPQSFTLLAFAKMLVSSFFQKGQPKKALKIFHWVSRLHLSTVSVVDSSFYALLVRGFCKDFMVLEALKVLKVMVEKDLVIGGEVRMWVYRGLLREARIKEALLLKESLENLEVGGVLKIRARAHTHTHTGTEREREREMAESAAAAAAAKVKSIFIYPIKSCRGISVSEAAITSTGFRWDRQWLVVNAKGRGYTQRIEPKLALVEVELPIQAFSEAWVPNSNSYLVIRAPGMDVLKVPLSGHSVITEGVSVWEWSGSALDEGDEASNWFSTFLQKPSRLVRFKEDTETRPVVSDRACGYNIKFNDLYQFLLLSQESLDALNDRLEEPISVNRFRPNIFIDGCGPFSEDLWKEIRINEITFHGTELCYRCKVPTINQETAIQGSEPSNTLMKFRSDKILRPDQKPRGRVYIGQMFVCSNALTEGKGGSVKVGDPIYVLQEFSSYVDAAT